MTIIARINEKGNLYEELSVEENNLQFYELTRDAQVFGNNEIAKFEIASELRQKGISIEAISRMLSIPQEALLAEFDSW